MLAIAARERPLGKAFIRLVARSPALWRQDILLCRWLLPTGAGHWGRRSSIGVWDHWTRGDGMSCRAGGCHPRGTSGEEGLHLFGCHISGQGETSCLTKPLAAARADRLLGKAIFRAVARSPAKQRRHTSPCRWSPPKRSGHWGSPSYVRLLVHRPWGMGCLMMPVVIAQEQRRLGNAIMYPITRSLRGETRCLALPVVAAREEQELGRPSFIRLRDIRLGEDVVSQHDGGCCPVERPLGKAMVYLGARSTAHGTRDISLCRSSFPQDEPPL